MGRKKRDKKPAIFRIYPETHHTFFALMKELNLHETEQALEFLIATFRHFLISANQLFIFANQKNDNCLSEKITANQFYDNCLSVIRHYREITGRVELPEPLKILENTAQTLGAHDRPSATYRKAKFDLSKCQNLTYRKAESDLTIPEITIQRLHTENNKKESMKEDTYVSSDNPKGLSSHFTHPPTPDMQANTHEGPNPPYREEEAQNGGGGRDPIFDGLITTLQGRTSRIAEWVDVVEEIYSEVGWDERSTYVLAELLEKTFITPKRLQSLLSGRAKEVAKKYGVSYVLKTILERVNLALSSGERRAKTFIGELTIKVRKTADIDPKTVFGIYSHAAERFPELRPVPWSETLRKRIAEVLRRSSKFRNSEFWETLFRKARDYVVYLSEQKKEEQTRDLFWILNDRVFEWIESDTRKDFSIITVQLDKRFIEELRRLDQQVLETLKKDMFASVARYSKAESGLILSTWNPSALVKAIEDADSAERFLESFYRAEYVKKILEGKR